MLTQKIYVMASAADRSLRILVSSPIASYYPKVVDIFFETVLSAKSPEQRKKSYEYLTIIMAIWQFSDSHLNK